MSPFISLLLLSTSPHDAGAYQPHVGRRTVVPSRRWAPQLAALDCFSSMTETYQSLASRCIDLFAGRDGALWVCIAGGPGSGKSTLSEAVSRCCEEVHGVPSVVLPMDGFHYSRAELRELDPPDAASFLPRRGAPHTFDAESFFAALGEGKKTGAAQLPTYSRELSDPVLGGAVLEPKHQIVFVEGNYLLLGALLEPPCEELSSAEEAEAARWKPLLSLFDETWFVAPPEGVQEQRRRLVERHLETWTPEKTVAWGASTAREGATKRTDFNDVPNAHLVEKCRRCADVVVDSV
jgi:pantothenate kinase